MPLSVPISAVEFVAAPGMRLTRLWEIRPVTAPALYFTEHDKAVTFEANVYSPAGGFDASAERLEGALKDHNKSFKGMITSDRITVEDLMGGVYNEAEVLERLVNWRYPWAGAVASRKYWIDKVDFDGEFIECELSGPTRRLKQGKGDVHTRTCTLKVGVVDPATGTGCSVDLSLFRVQGVRVIGVLDAQKRMIILGDTTGLSSSHGDGKFDDGEITFTSGRNAGYSRDVKRYTSFDRRIELHEPFPFEISIGDMFDLDIGCDGRRTTCKNVFNNLNEHNGDPYMPFTDRTISAGAS